MPSRHWIIAIALGLVVAADLGQAQEKAQNEQPATEQQEQPAQAFPVPFPVEIVEDQAAADAREASEAEARQREIDDLAAQQGMNAATQAMNDATQRMAEYALISTWLVGIGTVLLVVTLVLTIQANRAAVAAVLTNRAWITLSGANVGEATDCVVDGVPVKRGIVLIPSVTNSGNTPANDVKFFQDYKLVPFDAPIPTFAAKEDPQPGSAVSPRSGMTGRVALNDEQSQRFIGRQVKVFLYIWVSYLDGFSKKRRTTEICLEAIHGGGVTERGGTRSHAVDFNAVGGQNKYS